MWERYELKVGEHRNGGIGILIGGFLDVRVAGEGVTVMWIRRGEDGELYPDSAAYTIRHDQLFTAIEEFYENHPEHSATQKEIDEAAIEALIQESGDA